MKIHFQNLLKLIVMFTLTAFSSPAESAADSRFGQQSAPSLQPKIGTAKAQNLLSHLPVAFEENVGQTAKEVMFVSRQRGFTAFVARGELVLKAERSSCSSGDTIESRQGLSGGARAAQQDVIHLRFSGSNPEAKAEGLERLPGTTNYIRGNDPRRWHTRVPSFKRARIHDLYPGVDLIYYGHEGQLEYDLVLRPGADPGKIRLAVDPGNKLSVEPGGDLRIATPWGYIQQVKPSIFQEIDGRRVQVPGRYVLRGRRSASIQVAAYDLTKPLTIDPTLIFATYLGGSGSDNGDCSAVGNTIATDSFGDVFVAGSTLSTDFPTGSVIPVFSPTSAGATDVFVTALDMTGNLIYSTYIGGSGTDVASGIAVDLAYNIYVAGYTNSADFPVTPGTFLSHLPAPDPKNPPYVGFLLKLDLTGDTLAYSTYVGGSKNDYVTGVVVDETGAAYVAGYTESLDFPVKSSFVNGSTGGGSFRGGLWDAFVVKLDTMADVVAAPGSDLVYSSYLGGTGSDKAHGIAVDSSHNVYLTGETDSADFPFTQGAIHSVPGAGASLAFVTQLDYLGATLVYSASLGGDSGTIGYGIAVDSTGYAYVAGTTLATNFPTTAKAFQKTPGGGLDVFVAKLNPTGSAPLEYSSYLGGSKDDVAYGLAVDPMGDALVAGYTSSANFPLSSPVQNQIKSTRTSFLASVASTGDSLQYSTYLGGSAEDCIYSVATDAEGDVFVFGRTSSSDFPVTSGVMQTSYGGSGDAFVAFITPLNANPIPTVTAINPISAQAGDPGFTLTVNGSSFVPGSQVLWNGTALSTTLVSSTLLTASVTASDLLVYGTILVSVENPAPGGGVSNTVSFTVNVTTLPPPSVTSLAPPSILAGSPGLVLAVTGTGYVPGSRVLWNGLSIQTTFVSNSVLLAFIPKNSIAAPGSVTVAVSNGSGGFSNNFTFVVTAPNPVPVISSLNPASVGAGGSAFQVTITGSKFVEGAVMRWNGLDRPTGVVSSSQLVASVLPTDIASIGSAAITVFNPPPGGGVSNALKFSIGQVTTAVTVKDVTTIFSPFAEDVVLTASISGLNSDAGMVTFQVFDGSTKIGSAVSEKVLNRTAIVAYRLPAGIPPKGYGIEAVYSGNPLALDSKGIGKLSVTPDPLYTEVSLPSNGTVSTSSSGVGSLNTGYATVTPSATTGPIAIANLRVTSTTGAASVPGNATQSSPESILVTEAGILPAVPVSTTRLFVDYSKTTDSGIALVNPGLTTAIDVKAEFNNADGVSVGSTQIHLPPEGHTALFASGLLPQLPEPFLGTLTLSVVPNPYTIGGTFAAVNLASAISGRGEMLYNALPLTDLKASAGSATAILPHVVDGESLQTQIYIANPSATSSSIGTISFFDDAGKPLSLDFGDPSGPQSTIEYKLPPNGMAKFSSGGVGPVQAGYALITTKSGPPPLNSALFMFSEGTALVSRASVTDATPATWTRLYAEVASMPMRRDTGIALVNPGAVSAVVNLKLTGPGGKIQDEGLILAPHAHVAKFLTEIFAGKISSDFAGMLDVTSSVPVASLTLRLTTNQRGDSIYSTLPSADMHNPPQGVQLIPQVANGDGYSTEFIFINTAPSSGPVYLNLFDDSGAGIVPKIFW